MPKCFSNQAETGESPSHRNAAPDDGQPMGDLEMNKQAANQLVRLTQLGISWDDACALRRAAMTLQRWFELECGDGNNHGSWAIERDDNGDGPPFLVHHHYQHGRGEDYTTRTRIADREAGARKRIAKILANHPDLWGYVQTDPRGASLYIGQYNPATKGSDPSLFYNQGVAVFK